MTRCTLSTTGESSNSPGWRWRRGDPGRAALLAGAAEGLRRRAGLGAWPMLRQPEAALLDQVRQALSLDRFEQAYEAGTRLSQREAVAAARERGVGPQRS